MASLRLDIEIPKRHYRVGEAVEAEITPRNVGPRAVFIE